MTGPEFHQTGYGRTFFEGQLPTLIKTLKRIADSLERIAERLERKENADD
jgi:hypothetical protein